MTRRGGIHVTWMAPRELSAQVYGYVLAGDSDHEVVGQVHRLGAAMFEAVMMMLSCAGFQVRESENDMRPLSIDVTAGPGSVKRPEASS
jgi:hypothetical protein